MKNKDKDQIAVLAARIRRFHATDHQERPGGELRRWIEDPLRPTTDKGNLRINPLLVLVMVMAGLAAGTFLFFSVVQP